MEEAYSDTLIEKYLSGELSDEEKDAFEKQVDMDESLQKELHIALKARAAIYAHGIEKRKEDFATRWEEQQQVKKASSTRKLLPYLSIAAAVIALLILFNLFWPSPKLSNQQLFTQYYETPIASSIRAEGAVSSFRKANLAFNDEKYQEAAQLYATALADASFVQKDEARFFGGICFLELDQAEKALELFEQLSGADYQEMKNWYSVLAYIKLDQGEKAKEILRKIDADPAHHYHEKAQEVIDLL